MRHALVGVGWLHLSTGSDCAGTVRAPDWERCLLRCCLVCVSGRRSPALPACPLARLCPTRPRSPTCPLQHTPAAQPDLQPAGGHHVRLGAAPARQPSLLLLCGTASPGADGATRGAVPQSHGTARCCLLPVAGTVPLPCLPLQQRWFGTALARRLALLSTHAAQLTVRGVFPSCAAACWAAAQVQLPCGAREPLD